MRISDWSSDVCASDLDIRNFEPQTGTYSVDRYFPGTDTVEAARKIRERYKVDQCTTDSGALADLAAMEADIRAILPARSNEHLVYHRSEEHTSELQSLMRISYAFLCLKQQKTPKQTPLQH